MTLPDKGGTIPILKARCIHILCDHRPQTEYTNRVLVMKQVMCHIYLQKYLTGFAVVSSKR